MFNEEQATKVKTIVAKRRLRDDFRCFVNIFEFVIERNAIRRDENHN